MGDFDLTNMSDDVKALNPHIGATPKASKYKNVKTYAAGMTFPSGREAVRAGELILLIKIFEIFCLCFQVRFPLPGKTEYVADFVYLNKKLEVVVEDSKGFRTRDFIRKKRQFKEAYGLDITEV